MKTARRMPRSSHSSLATILLTVAAALALALSACARDGGLRLDPATAAKIDALAEQVTEARLQALMADFSANRNAWESPAAAAAAQDALQAGFEASGWAVSRQEVSVEAIWHWDGMDWISEPGPFFGDNVIAAKAGSDPALAPVLIIAHHDTVVGAPGADDNGSGCAGLLACADILGGASFDREIRLIAFAFEEDGLVGSRLYAESLSDDELPNCVLNLEMIGYTSENQDVPPGADILLGMPRTGDFLGAFGSEASRSLALDFLACAGTWAPALPVYAASVDSNLPNDFVLSSLYRSDHAPFWERGVSALMITDTAELREGSPYHTEEDSVDKIDFAFMSGAVKATLATAALRAGIR